MAACIELRSLSSSNKAYRSAGVPPADSAMRFNADLRCERREQVPEEEEDEDDREPRPKGEGTLLEAFSLFFAGRDWGACRGVAWS